MLLRHTQPADAFAFGVKSLQINSDIPKDILKQIKKDWCNYPEGFQTALNWKTYDSICFLKAYFLPHGNSARWEPSLGSY